jgi:hypothetical protein
MALLLCACAGGSNAPIDEVEDTPKPTPTVEPTPEIEAPEDCTVSYDPVSHIQRTTLNTEGEGLEIYFEIPVFEESTPGYDKINEFFTSMRDDFFSPDDIAAYREWSVNRPDDEEQTYYFTWTADINDWQDEILSVSLSYSWWMGGVYDYGMNSYNFRTDTGEQLILSDLLDGSDDEIREMIISALEEQYQDIEIWQPDAIEAVREYNVEDFDFYILDGHIHVFFDKYEISYGAAGAFDVELPTELFMSK